jgi:Zn-dependent M28 family amino/carboxypeptidase
MIIVHAITLPALISVMFFVNWKLPVEGAADDLTGVFTSMATLLYLKNNDIRFENTEVVAVSMGAEEEGLRGSKAFAQAHGDEYTNDGVETIFVALDTLRDYDFMGIVTKDMTATVSLDKQACALMKKAAENADVPVNFTTTPLGSTDAAATQQGGIKSVAFTSMDPAQARYYHTRDDNVKVLEMKTLEDSLKVVLETVFLFDEQGLKDSY